MFFQTFGIISGNDKDRRRFGFDGGFDGLHKQRLAINPYQQFVATGAHADAGRQNNGGNRRIFAVFLAVIGNDQRCLFGFAQHGLIQYDIWAADKIGLIDFFFFGGDTDKFVGQRRRHLVVVVRHMYNFRVAFDRNHQIGGIGLGNMVADDAVNNRF